MADDTNEDSWLYGTSNPDSTTNDEDDGNESAALDRFLQDQEQTQKENEANQLPDSNDNEEPNHHHDDEEHDPTDDFEEDPAHQMEEGEVSMKDDEPKDPGDSDDDSDDDINVVIGDIKSAPTSGTYNIKQRQLPAGGTAAGDKKQTQGK